MAYGSYQQPGTLRPQVEPRMPGSQLPFEAGQPAAPLDQPGPDMTPGNPPAVPPAQAQALTDVQQAYMQPNPQPAYSPGQGAGMFLGNFLQQQAATPSLSDSALQPIVAAGRLADQRSADRQRAALAEQLGAGGLGSSGAMNVGQGKIRQAQGETQALRESGLLQDETQARRAALLSGLGLDASRYQTDTSAGLQLAQLEALLNAQATAPFVGGY